MEECKKCPAFAKCIWNHGGAMCKALRKSYGLDETQKPLTNADRFRGMSDEEMAEYCGRVVGCPTDGSCHRHSGSCVACWLDWLHQPVHPTPDAPDTHEHGGLLEE